MIRFEIIGDHYYIQFFLTMLFGNNIALNVSLVNFFCEYIVNFTAKTLPRFLYCFVILHTVFKVCELNFEFYYAPLCELSFFSIICRITIHFWSYKLFHHYSTQFILSFCAIIFRYSLWIAVYQFHSFMNQILSPLYFFFVHSFYNCFLMLH